ncbi:porin [Microvirga zambiensis]|uniref:porin n=1 Tax=Microvirga zambiensis TaxID=1402137 RepID=UPI00191D45AD|nr:porin [Microvirga zambiensis]
MKLVKSLLLGTAAGLAAVAGAHAADLPVKKAAAVEYVRLCSTYGAGFFYIPGTETCLRVGGRVRAEYLYAEPTIRADDTIGFRARGRIQLDARTATAYGLLRTFVRMEMTRNTGAYGFSSTSPNIAQAFIQFGGLTAGRVTSFFSNSDMTNDNWGTVRFYDAPDVNLLAYTFTFGNGFSASLSLEDGTVTRLNGFVAGGANVAALDYAGERAPDVVANVKYVGTWGSAQLSGAVHQIRSGNPLIGGDGAAFYPDTEYGYAVSGQVAINLPMLAAGDSVWFAATYANGALAYLGFDEENRAGRASGAVADAYVDLADGEIERAHGWSVAGGLQHYWTPEVRQSIFGSYARVEYGSGASVINNAGFVTGLADFNEWRVGTNLIWSPVSGLDIGAEVIYANVDPRGRVIVDGAEFGSDSAWEGRLRVQRTF